MPPLSRRLALPLAVIVLMGATVSARANVTYNLCKLYCEKKAAGGLTDSQEGNCFGLAFYVANELKCDTPEAQKKEPCATSMKLFKFICPGQPVRLSSTGPVCSVKWMAQCYKAGGIPDPSSIVPLSSPSRNPPKTPSGQKSDVTCAPNMMRGAQGTCVPRLDNMPGSDSTLGSTPGAGRTAPAGGPASAPAGRR